MIVFNCLYDLLVFFVGSSFFTQIFIPFLCFAFLIMIVDAIMSLILFYR